MRVDELAAAPWIGPASTGAEPLLGVWPGLPGRPRVVHAARDWFTKLALVAGGFGVTTVPCLLAGILPRGVALVRVDGVPAEVRRVLLARLPGPPAPAVAAVARALAEVV
ncbi:LysR substrate-binding domain-containing protein [Streptomyces sp. NPDC088923]|uniref:LysR substrate-binding domain-containing protein n=1 Tax=Streptomyces sp. NPDC088923 TaxID=3365913 RepID=UPI00382A523B